MQATSFPSHREFCMSFSLSYFSSLSNSSWVLSVRKNRRTHVHEDHRQGHTTHTKTVRPQKLMAFLSLFRARLCGRSQYLFFPACMFHTFLASILFTSLSVVAPGPILCHDSRFSKSLMGHGKNSPSQSWKRQWGGTAREPAMLARTSIQVLL